MNTAKLSHNKVLRVMFALVLALGITASPLLQGSSTGGGAAYGEVVPLAIPSYPEIESVNISSQHIDLNQEYSLNISFKLLNELAPNERVLLQLFPDTEQDPYPDIYLINPSEGLVDFSFSPKFENYQPGHYTVYVSIIDAITFQDSPYVSIGEVWMSNAGPFLDMPIFEDVRMEPAYLNPGSAEDRFRLFFTAVFSNTESSNDPRMVTAVLYRDTEAGSVVVDEQITGLSPNPSIPGRMSGETTFFTDSLGFLQGFQAGYYHVELFFNYGTEFENENHPRVIEFTIDEFPTYEAGFLIHTEKGLLPSLVIGTEDVFDLCIDDWWDAAPGPQLFATLLPADVPIGSSNWTSAQIYLQEYSAGLIATTNGRLTVPNFNLAADAPALESGEYVLSFLTNSGKVKTLPFWIVEGKTEVEAILENIELRGVPDKLAYRVGEAFDPSGLKVIARYDCLEDQPITNYTTSPAKGDILGADDTEVTVQFEEDGVIKTAVFPITIYPDSPWTTHRLEDVTWHDEMIVIAPDSGNHIITGTFENGFEVLDGEFIVTVQAGYDGVIRFENAVIDLSENTSGGAFTIESYARATVDLVGSNTLRSRDAHAGMLVEGLAELGIESNSNGSLDASSDSYGAGIGGGTYNGTAVTDAGYIKIRGNARVNASSTEGAGIGGFGGSTVIISGDAEVTAHSSFGAGIGGYQSRDGGLISIKGNAHVNASSTDGAGIGGGSGSGTGGEGGLITIGENAVVNASSEAASAIGGGRGGFSSAVGEGGASGTIVIEGQAQVSAISHGLYAAGIGGGSHYSADGYSNGNAPANIRITGGIVNAANTNGGVDLGSTSPDSTVSIDGGSVYLASEDEATLTNSVGKTVQLAKLIVQDEDGVPLDNVSLLLGGFYPATTGGNYSLENEDFASEPQHGVAYVWLPRGEQTVSVLHPEGESQPQVITVGSTVEEIVITIEGGSGEQVGAPGSGDINGDDKVTVSEAVLALRFIAGLETGFTPAQIDAADIDRDGNLTIADAILMLRKIAGL